MFKITPKISNFKPFRKLSYAFNKALPNIQLKRYAKKEIDDSIFKPLDKNVIEV